MSTSANMSLQEVVDGIKVDSQTGEVGNNLDTVAAAILRHFNAARQAFWEMNNWDWSKVDISLAVPASTESPISLAATVGDIISLGIKGASGELDIFTESEWRKWRKANSASDEESIYGAVLRGRDSSGNLRVLFVGIPATATDIEGVGKLRLNPVRYTIAQIATQTTFDYFPDEVIPTLYDWTYGRYLRIIKDARADGVLESVQNRVDALKGTQRTQPVVKPVTHPPAYIRWANGQRGGRSTV